jgi:hypothetical protein
MNWKSTAALLVLTAVAGVWLWKGDAWVPRLAPQTAPPDPPALAALEDDLTTDSLNRIEIVPTGGDAFVFDKTAQGWSQPGNWPLRSVEVNELVELLGTLRTRFQPVPLGETPDLAAYGLADAQKPLVVKVKAGDKDYVLKFGEPALKPGELPFTRSAYVRVGEDREVLKLGPDVMPVLRRPADSYRRRQLFSDVERVKVAGVAPPFQPGLPPEPPAPANLAIPGPTVEEIRVSAKSPKLFGYAPWASSGSFTLKRIAPTPGPTITDKNAEPTIQPDRLADSWALDAPVRDRPDPAVLQKVLSAIPDLWVEEFIPASQLNGPKDPREELKNSQQSITVVTKSGPITVKFGGIAKTVEREEQAPSPPPMIPGLPPQPPMTRKVLVPYRYAQIEGNPQVFTVPADKLNAIFAKAGDLAASNVAPVHLDDVWSATIERPGKPPIVLSRKKGNPKATKPEERQDRWLIEQNPNPLLADSNRVEDFINQITTFRGNPDSDLYRADPKAHGLDPATCVTVTLVAREKRPEGEPDAPSREYKVRIGTADIAAGKLPVQLVGWPRITLVPDRAGGPPPVGWLAPKLFPERLEPVFRRDAVAFRSGKLFDTADAKLNAVTVDGASGFALKHAKNAAGQDEWKLTAPIASDTDLPAVGLLVNELGNLRATEFVAEAATNPAEYGLDKPKFTVTLAFDNGRTYKLEVGGARPGKPELFARLDGGAVFAIPTTATDKLNAGAIALLPLRVWSVQLDKLTGVEVTRLDKPTESFTLVSEASNWKLTAPFAAAVPYQNLQPLLVALANLNTTKYEALSATDPVKYGFDKPLGKVKLTYTEKVNDKDAPVSKTLLIGGVTPGGLDRYAKLDEPNAPVFVLPATYLFPAQTPPLSLLDRNLLSLDATKIAKVQITGDKPENAITLMKDDKGVWKAEGATFAVDAVVAKQVADTFAPLFVERLVAYGDAVKWADFGLEKPEYTVVITLSGEKPETHTLQLGKAEMNGSRYVRVDGGKAVGVIPASAVQSLARAKLDFADRTLLTFKPEEFLGLMRVKGKEELELAPGAGDGWDVVKPAKLKADKPLVEELADSLSKLRAERVVAFGKKEDVFKQFGLEPAEATITLTLGEKAEQKVLRLGRPVDAAKPDGDRFAALESPGADAAVVVLPAALVNKLLAPAVSFRDRTIVKFVDADQLQLERAGRMVTFNKVAGSWKVTKPLMADAEQAALDDLVNELAKLRASDWVSGQPTPAELKTFGLENPEATWTVSNGDKVVLVLKLGKTAPDGRVYATTGTGGAVALLGVPQSAKVLAEYRARKPWMIVGFEAETIEVNRGGKPFTLKKTGNAWSDPAAPTDVIDPRPVAELLGGLTALQVERFAVDADADLKLFGLDKPDTVITVTLKDGSTRSLAIGGVVGGTDNKQRYARVLDKGRTDVFVLSAADTERFTRDRAAFVMMKK